jgi:putative transposase
MKKRRFSEQQMVKILREADRTPIAGVAKERGVSERRIDVWRRRFGKMEVADTKKLKPWRPIMRASKMVADRDHPEAQLRGRPEMLTYRSAIGILPRL